jgi:hypothetical protein
MVDDNQFFTGTKLDSTKSDFFRASPISPIPKYFSSKNLFDTK